MVAGPGDNSGLSLVDVDIDHGVDVAVAHLVRLGHRNVGFLTIDPGVGDTAYGFATWALAAYKRACQRYGLVPRSGSAAPNIDAMSGAAQQLLDDHPDTTALVCPQEQSAIGVVRAVKARGIRIPEDLSIVALLTRSMAELATPALTTIDFPADDMGKTAARILVDRLDRGDAAVEQICLKPDLIVRES